MTNLLVAREMVKKFYGKYEAFIVPVLKFLLMLVTLCMINSSLGFMERIDHIVIVLMVSLLCSFLPSGFMILFAAFFVLLHFYALGIEVAAIAVCVFLIMFLLFFRFSPKDSLVVLLTPVLFVLKIPYVIPLAMGLIGAPISIISVGCGVVVYFFVNYVSVNALTLKGMESEEMMARIRLVIDSILNNKAMMVTVVAFAITIFVVYTVRRLAIDHSWTIAMVAGVIVNIVVLLIGDLIFDTNESILWLILGSVISLLLTKILQFFVFNVDYSRTERVQFEDDEYYYYVKAVPKITLAAPEKTVKQINTRTKVPSSTGRSVVSDRVTPERTVTVERTRVRTKNEEAVRRSVNRRSEVPHEEEPLDFDNLE